MKSNKTRDLFNSFTDKMLEKLRKHEDTRGESWLEDDWENDCVYQFYDAINNNDFVSAANFLMFANYHGWDL